MLIWILTVYLAGVPIVEEDGKHSLRECKDRGFELARWYQQDHLRVEFGCEEYYASRNNQESQPLPEIEERRDPEAQTENH